MNFTNRRFARTSLLLLLIVLCYSCTQESEERTATKAAGLRAALVGSWENEKLRLVIAGEKDSVLEVTRENWTDILQIRPILSKFQADSSYSSTYFSPEGEEIMTIAGTWFVKQDSLYILEREVPNVYFLRVEGDTAFFKGYVDWDKDGHKDDLYEGIQVRQ